MEEALKLESPSYSDTSVSAEVTHSLLLVDKALTPCQKFIQKSQVEQVPYSIMLSLSKVAPTSHPGY